MLRVQTLAPIAAGVLSLCAVSGAHADQPSSKSNNGNGNANGHETHVAMIGDLPYRDGDIPKLDEVLREINQARVDFTLHNGDIKSGSSLCADDLLQQRFDQLKQLERPLVYTPGDNEWTDCHRPAAGGF